MDKTEVLKFMHTLINRYEQRCKKAESIGIGPDSRHYDFYREFQFRVQLLRKCCSYVDSLRPSLNDLDVVARMTGFILDLFRSHASPDETDIDYALAERAMSEDGSDTAFLQFSKQMENFHCYSPQNEDELQSDLLRFLAAGVNLWLMERKHIAANR